MPADPQPAAATGDPRPEELAVDRPRLAPAPATTAGCLRFGLTLGGLVWIPLQALWPAAAPPPGPLAELLPLAVGAAAVALMWDMRLAWGSTAAYRLLGCRRLLSYLPHLWWRYLLLLVWLPGLLVLLAQRGQELAVGAAPLGPWWAALGGLVGAVCTMALLSTLIDAKPVFLHAAGIQNGVAYFHPWSRITGIRRGGASGGSAGISGDINGDELLVLDQGGERSHPVAWLALPPAARDDVLAEAARRGIAVRDGLPVMLPGKLAALLATAALALLAGRLAATGLAWPLLAVLLIAAGVGIKFIEERLTGIRELLSNPLKDTAPVPDRATAEQEDFARRWRAAFLALHPAAEIETLGPLTLRARLTPGGDWSEHRLDNAWQDFLRAPRERERIIATYTAAAVEAGGLGAVQAQRLLATVRHRDMFAGFPPDQAPVNRPLAGDLVVVLAEDLPRTIRYVNASDLTGLGLDHEAAWRAAFANLATLAGEREVAGRDGFFTLRVPWHAAAVLCEPGFLTDLRFPVEGDWLVALPQRDVALVTGEREPDARARLRTAIAAEHGGSGSLSTLVFRVTRDGSWSVDAG